MNPHHFEESEHAFLSVSRKITFAITSGNASYLDLVWDPAFSGPLLSMMHQAALDAGADTVKARAVYLEYQQKLHTDGAEKLLKAAAQSFCALSAEVVQMHRSDSELGREVKAYIQLHLSSKLKARGIARACALSERSLYDLFRAEFHCTLSEYIQKERLRHSVLLMMRTRMTISEIALSLGFSSCSYYSNVFCRYYGCSPSEYRRRLDAF